MKKILVVAIALIVSVSSFGQDNTTLTLDSFYQSKEDFIVYSKVLDFPNKNKTEIMNGFKNWGSVNFNNLKQITVSETDDQIVLNYITKQMYVKSLGMTVICEWYVRLVAEFKDGKMRITYHDDGNTFWPGNQYALATSARTMKLASYFKEDGTASKRGSDGLKNFKKVLVDLTSSIKLEDQKKNTDNW